MKTDSKWFTHLTGLLALYQGTRDRVQERKRTSTASPAQRAKR